LIIIEGDDSIGGVEAKLGDGLPGLRGEKFCQVGQPMAGGEVPDLIDAGRAGRPTKLGFRCKGRAAGEASRGKNKGGEGGLPSEAVDEVDGRFEADKHLGQGLGERAGIGDGAIRGIERGVVLTGAGIDEKNLWRGVESCFENSGLGGRVIRAGERQPDVDISDAIPVFGERGGGRGEGHGDFDVARAVQFFRHEGRSVSDRGGRGEGRELRGGDENLHEWLEAMPLQCKTALRPWLGFTRILFSARISISKRLAPDRCAAVKKTSREHREGL
jgi:hypothetical protein